MKKNGFERALFVFVSGVLLSGRGKFESSRLKKKGVSGRERIRRLHTPPRHGGHNILRLEGEN